MANLKERLRKRKASWIGAGMDPDELCQEAAARIEALEARVAAADKLAEVCESAFDGNDATGPREFYLTLAAYQATKEQSDA